MRFTKMQGLGNDYLYVYGEVPENIAELSRKLSDRHFGPGSDGMIYIRPSQCADFRMRIFNADGSEALMCGNGIRCAAKYVYEKNICAKKEMRIETGAGIRTAALDVKDGIVTSVSVGMGQAAVKEKLRLTILGKDYEVIPVSVGNPHAVIFTDDAEGVPLETVGPLIEHDPNFPGGVNAEFVQKTGENRLRMRVWERGSGITMACGTGASASAAAAAAEGLVQKKDPIFVTLDGGVLEITVSETYEVTMKGPAEFVFEGEAYL